MTADILLLLLFGIAILGGWAFFRQAPARRILSQFPSPPKLRATGHFLEDRELKLMQKEFDQLDPLSQVIRLCQLELKKERRNKAEEEHLADLRQYQKGIEDWFSAWRSLDEVFYGSGFFTRSLVPTHHQRIQLFLEYYRASYHRYRLARERIEAKERVWLAEGKKKTPASPKAPSNLPPKPASPLAGVSALDLQLDFTPTPRVPKPRSLALGDLAQAIPNLSCITYLDEFFQLPSQLSGELAEADFSLSYFVGVRFVGPLQIAHSNFHQSDLSHAQLGEGGTQWFFNCNFQQASFQQAKVKAVAFFHCDFSGAQLQGARFEGAKFVHCRFETSQLEGADFLDCYFSKESFCNLESRPSPTPAPNEPEFTEIEAIQLD